MGLPAVLKNYNIFNDGDSYLGQTSEVALPKLALKVEQWRGGGMLGEIDLDMGLEKLELEIKYGGMVRGVMRQFGLVGVAGVQLRFVGAYQEELNGTVDQGELVVRGKHTELDPGTAKAGDKTEWSCKSTLAYLKWSINGAPIVEIDMLTGLFMVDGVDRTAAIRTALQS